MNDSDIGDNEPLYRRIPIANNWYDEKTETLDAEAFLPSRRDVDGLSISRGKSDAHTEFLSPEQFARIGQCRHGYYVAEVSAGSLKEFGILIKTAPTDDDPGHCILPQFKYTKPRSKQINDWAEILAVEKTSAVHGPFIPSAD